MVEAACDLSQVSLHSVRDVTAARELLEGVDEAVIMLAGDLEDAAELLVELLGRTILWMGASDAPGAEMASATLEKPLDIVSVQMALEEHLHLAPPELTPPPAVDASSDTDASRVQVIEAERDALLAELEVLRHESTQVRREAEASGGAERQELKDLRAALDTQRRTAEALQSAYGEVEQAHGKLRQRYEALEAERDALAERSREVSALREALERAERDNALLKAQLSEALVRADNASRALGLRAATQHDAEAAMSEAGWWQDAVKEAADDGP